MKSLRKFPIGSLVKWLQGMTLNEQLGLVVAYVDIAMGTQGQRLMALQVFTGDSIEYVKPGICKTISRPYVKARKDINFVEFK